MTAWLGPKLPFISLVGFRGRSLHCGISLQLRNQGSAGLNDAGTVRTKGISDRDLEIAAAKLGFGDWPFCLSIDR